MINIREYELIDYKEQQLFISMAHEIYRHGFFEKKECISTANALKIFLSHSKIIEKIEIDRQCILRPIEEREVFISYARKRPHEADYIETLLRRRNISVFRDESEFGAGEDIPIQIEEHIHRANTFIAVYCTEYACSPWCYDELELALDLREKNQIDIWLICVDDTRIVSKRARNLMFYKTHSREDIEGKILKLIMQ